MQSASSDSTPPATKVPAPTLNATADKSNAGVNASSDVVNMPHRSGQATGAIVGGVIVGVLCIALVAVCVFRRLQKHRSRSGSTQRFFSSDSTTLQGDAERSMNFSNPSSPAQKNTNGPPSTVWHRGSKLVKASSRNRSSVFVSQTRPPEDVPATPGSSQQTLTIDQSERTSRNQRQCAERQQLDAETRSNYSVDRNDWLGYRFDPMRQQERRLGQLNATTGAGCDVVASRFSSDSSFRIYEEQKKKRADWIKKRRMAAEAAASDPADVRERRPKLRTLLKSSKTHFLSSKASGGLSTIPSTSMPDPLRHGAPGTDECGDIEEDMRALDRAFTKRGFSDSESASPPPKSGGLERAPRDGSQKGSQAQAREETPNRWSYNSYSSETRTLGPFEMEDTSLFSRASASDQSWKSVTGEYSANAGGGKC